MKNKSHAVTNVTLLKFLFEIINANQADELQKCNLQLFITRDIKSVFFCDSVINTGLKL
jgi:hypothetical protein